MSELYFILDPLRELFVEHSGADVGEPLLWSLRELERGLRQILVYFRMVSIQIASDLFDAKALISTTNIKSE